MVLDSFTSRCRVYSARSIKLEAPAQDSQLKFPGDVGRLKTQSFDRLVGAEKKWDVFLRAVAPCKQRTDRGCKIPQASNHAYVYEQWGESSSVTEVEVVVGVGIVLTLAEDGADEVEGASWEGNAHPDAHAVVDEDTVDEEALEATVHEVEEPLLGRV